MECLFTEAEMIDILESSGKFKVRSFSLYRQEKSFNDKVDYFTYPCNLVLSNENNSNKDLLSEINVRNDIYIKSKYGVKSVFKREFKKVLRHFLLSNI